VTAAVLLAAGASRRLGRPKQLVELDGEPLVHRIARIALTACEPVAVVAGAVPLGDVLADLPVAIVDNVVWAEGIASSIRAGIAWASAAEAVVLLTCDQLLLDGAHLHMLIRASGGSRLAASRYEGVLGVPAVFPCELFPVLLALEGDRGAQPLLEAAVPVDWPAGARDLDTLADLSC
jgi:CTP:molybdopterin cytidylyltransferase MocA